MSASADLYTTLRTLTVSCVDLGKLTIEDESRKFMADVVEVATAFLSDACNEDGLGDESSRLPYPLLVESSEVYSHPLLKVSLVVYDLLREIVEHVLIEVMEVVKLVPFVASTLPSLCFSTKCSLEVVCTTTSHLS